MTDLKAERDRIAESLIGYSTWPTKEIITAALDEYAKLVMEQEPSDKMLMCWGHEWITGQAQRCYRAMRQQQLAEMEKKP